MPVVPPPQPWRELGLSGEVWVDKDEAAAHPMFKFCGVGRVEEKTSESMADDFWCAPRRDATGFGGTTRSAGLKQKVDAWQIWLPEGTLS